MPKPSTKEPTLMRRQAAEHLMNARELVDAAQRRLNTQSHVCESCGANRAESWTEAQAALELEAVSRKLEKWRRRLLMSDEQLKAAQRGEIVA